VRLVIGYDGTGYSGSQLQPGMRTVQGELERAIAGIGGGNVRVALAGRTDRGVHAVGQVASVQMRWRHAAHELREALNSGAPDDLVVATAEFVAEGFHARYSARWREYRYRIVEAPAPPVLRRHHVWWRRSRIDPELANEAASRFVGRHGFGSFVGLGKSNELAPEQLERTVCCSVWRSWHSESQEYGGSAQLHEYRIIAEGYLPQMVRTIVSATVEVAQGRREIDWLDAALARSDRSLIGEPAPPHGLTLWRVGYDEDITVASSAGAGNDEQVEC
jgi:tRNA pseudouridine38-40 synthase